MSFLILDGQLLLIYQTKSIEPMNKAIQHLIKQLKYDCSSTERPWTYVCIVWLVKVAVRLGQKIRETVKGKLNLGAKILQVGGLRKVYKQLFSVREGEKLLKACQCHLSTTTGPLAGLLFISTHKLAFCSDKSLKFSSPTGELLRFHYKVTTYLFLKSLELSKSPFLTRLRLKRGYDSEVLYIYKKFERKVVSR